VKHGTGKVYKHLLQLMQAFVATVAMNVVRLMLSCNNTCRYVNGADPNRRRFSYKGMADGVAAPLKHWHLLEGE
jgi:hypothetical protein